MMSRHQRRFCGLFLVAIFVLLVAHEPLALHGDSSIPELELRAWGVPSAYSSGPVEEANRAILDAFRRRYPWVNPVSTTGLIIPGGSRTMDMVPFMQIAGDIAPHVLYVNFRQSQSYIDMKLLYPLDEYIEELAMVSLDDGSSLSNEDYVRALEHGRNWPEIAGRVPEQCWEVMRRQCPYDKQCPHRSARRLTPLAAHRHVFSYPVGPLVTGMEYNRLLFAEHADQGVELRSPRDWEELLRWAKIMTNPPANEYGLKIEAALPSWNFANFLYSAGGQIVEEDEQGNWRCVLDSEAAVTAAYFWGRLRFEKVERDGQVYRGVVRVTAEQAISPIRYAMSFTYLDDRFLDGADDQTKQFGSVPAGPTGLRRSELNAMMLGIFSGLADDPRLRDASWNYIQFYDGPEARSIRVDKMVEAGLGRFVRRKLLERFNIEGRYDSIIRRIDPELEHTYEVAFEGGVPEPYGRNCQPIYDEMRKPLGEIWSSMTICDAIDRGDEAAARAEIRGILARATKKINQELLGNLPPAEQKKRNAVAWATIIAAMVIFACVLRKVFQTFTPPHLRRTASAETSGRQSTEIGCWQFHRYARSYVLMAPALLLIAMWMYWPMLQGTAIAFQDYGVLGDSRWVGAANFANVLFSAEFWHSLLLAIIYALLFMIFGFWTPIALAFLLSEIPRGTVFFRTIYYLPGLLTGVVVIFLWKSFYGPDGMINEVLNGAVWLMNLVPGVTIGYFHEDWLQKPAYAMFFCLLPTVWAGLGPGCLIYLAALKTVPEELYEAADIDGASIARKIFSIAVPTIKILVVINFIGAMIGAIRGSGGFILAMTGGGPYGESGGATEVVGLRLFYTTFGYLQFGVGAAMAWIVGAMLIGFTVLQLKRLANIEFRTVERNA